MRLPPREVDLNLTWTSTSVNLYCKVFSIYSHLFNLLFASSYRNGTSKYNLNICGLLRPVTYCFHFHLDAAKSVAAISGQYRLFLINICIKWQAGCPLNMHETDCVLTA